MSIPEFAELSGINEKLVRQLVASGSIPTKLIGARRLINRESAQRWLADSDPPNSTAKGRTSPPEAPKAGDGDTTATCTTGAGLEP